jgi:hypothetical protein
MIYFQATADMLCGPDLAVGKSDQIEGAGR